MTAQKQHTCHFHDVLDVGAHTVHCATAAFSFALLNVAIFFELEESVYPSVTRGAEVDLLLCPVSRAIRHVATLWIREKKKVQNGQRAHSKEERKTKGINEKLWVQKIPIWD